MAPPSCDDRRVTSGVRSTPSQEKSLMNLIHSTNRLVTLAALKALLTGLTNFGRTASVLPLIMSAVWVGPTQAGPVFTANTGGSVHGFVGASESGPQPVGVSGSGINSGGVAMGSASASPGSLSAFATILQPSGAQPQVALSSTATFRIDDLVFSLASGATFTPGASFTTSLNYGLSGGIDLVGMDTTGGVTIAMAISAFNVDVSQGGSFSATHSLGDFQPVTAGAWVINRSGLLSSFATDLEAVGGNTAAPTLVAYDELLFTSPSFTLTANGNGVIASPSVFMRLTAGVGGPRFRGNFASATSDFGNTLNFATGGPVFNLPEGITVNSTDGLIVDNRWAVIPEPASWMMLGTGAAAWMAGLAMRRKRRSAVGTPLKG